MQQVVKKFLDLVSRYSLAVFLVDVATLGRLSQRPTQPRGSQANGHHCSLLCSSRGFTTFAMLAKFWKYDVRNGVVLKSTV